MLHRMFVLLFVLTLMRSTRMYSRRSARAFFVDWPDRSSLPMFRQGVALSARRARSQECDFHLTAIQARL